MFPQIALFYAETPLKSTKRYFASICMLEGFALTGQTVWRMEKGTSIRKLLEEFSANTKTK